MHNFVNFYCMLFLRFYDVFIRSCLFLIVPEMVKICVYTLILEPLYVNNLFCDQVLCCGTSILEDNIQIEIQQKLS